MKARAALDKPMTSISRGTIHDARLMVAGLSKSKEDAIYLFEALGIERKTGDTLQRVGLSQPLNL